MPGVPKGFWPRKSPPTINVIMYSLRLFSCKYICICMCVHMYIYVQRGSKKPEIIFQKAGPL